VREPQIDVKNNFDANRAVHANVKPNEDLMQFVDPANGVAYTDKTLST
jgi:hypothetical protein